MSGMNQGTKRRLMWVAVAGILGTGAAGAAGYEAPDAVVWALAGLAALTVSPEAVRALGKLRG